MKIREIVKARDYHSMIGGFANDMPEIGEYLITGIQQGNLNGELGWQMYIGYVVQIRKKAGAFGSDIILLRHPDGTLGRHENQSYHRVSDYWLKEIKKKFNEDITPDNEDYSKPYTLGDKYPETGKIIEPSDNMPVQDNSPMMSITTTHRDGSKEIVVV